MGATTPGILLVSIARPSADGRYYGRYPQGNAPVWGGAAVAKTSAAADLTTNPAQTFVLESLDTGINNGVVFQDDAGGNTGTWMTDSTGGFGRLDWAAGGTAGFRWFGLDPTQREIYIQYDLRRTNVLCSKEVKLFGFVSPQGNFSNRTGGCSAGGYSGQNISNTYSDSVGGGDNSVQWFDNQFPSLTGGSSYSRTPHPVAFITGGGIEAIDGSWHTRGFYWKQNDDGTPNGAYAEFLDGVCIFSCGQMWNCGTGLQGFSRLDWGGYTPLTNAGLIEDYRRLRVGYFQPSGTGIPPS